SAGTYVRTLAHDLGLALGCGAALSALRRLRSEPFGIERSLTPDQLADLTREEALARAGTPLDRALDVLPAGGLGGARARRRGAAGRGPALGRAARRRRPRPGARRADRRPCGCEPRTGLPARGVPLGGAVGTVSDRAEPKGAAVTIGVYDGLHVGHRAIL